MPTRHFKELPLERRVIDKIIYFVAAFQPIGGVPQIIVIYTNRDASSISILSWLFYMVFDLLWLWYGVDHKQKVVIVSAILFALVDGAVALGGILYGGSL